MERMTECSRLFCCEVYGNICCIGNLSEARVFDPIWERDNSRLREEGKSIMSGICKSGGCNSFSMLEILCLVPVVLESSFRLWNGVLVKLHRDRPSSRSFSTSSSPLANLASRLSRPQFLNIHIWIGLYEVSAHLRKINGFVPTISVER